MPGRGSAAPEHHFMVLAPGDEFEGACPRAVRTPHGRGAHRHEPREEVAAVLEAYLHGPLVLRRYRVHALHQPSVRRDDLGVAQPREARDHVRGGSAARAERVDESVVANLGQLAVSGREPVRPRVVVDVERSLVEKLDDAGIVDGLREDGVERGDALHRTRERGREEKRRGDHDACASSFRSIFFGAPGSAASFRRIIGRRGRIRKSVGAFFTYRKILPSS